MQHASTNTFHLSPTGGLMDPDYLRGALRPSEGGLDPAEIIGKLALTSCALAVLCIAVAVLAGIG